MNFEFATATRIIFGEGKRFEAIAAAKSFGHRVLIVSGNNTTRTDWLRSALENAGLTTEIFPVTGEPKVIDAELGASRAREFQAEMVIGLGGGSAIDAGKAIAALCTNTRPAIDYLEVIGSNLPIEHDPLPCIAIPTTAGTGAEVTRNAVLTAPDQKVKVSLRSPRMLPRVAIVDPELTYSLPPPLTAATGMDALTQLVEPFLSARANPMTDALCREALPRVARALPRVFENSMDTEARLDMALGSLFGGLALANAGLGAVHGFAAPIGGMFPAPHGAVCAALLPVVLDVNQRALRQRGDRARQDRFSELGRLLTGEENASAPITFTQQCFQKLKIPRLKDYGVEASDFDRLCEKAANSSSMKANPVPLTHDELREILSRAV